MVKTFVLIFQAGFLAFSVILIGCKTKRPTQQEEVSQFAKLASDICPLLMEVNDLVKEQEKMANGGNDIQAPSKETALELAKIAKRAENIQDKYNEHISWESPSDQSQIKQALQKQCPDHYMFYLNLQE